MARAARRELKLDRVLLIPARISPLKPRRPAPPRHRLAMLRIAVRGLPWLRIGTQELRRSGPSYTIDTLKVLHRRFPRAELFLLMGSDAFKEFRRWRDPAGIRRLAHLAVFARPGSPFPKHVQKLSMPLRSISASALRMALAGEHHPPEGGISRVLAYARKHGIYRL